MRKRTSTLTSPTRAQGVVLPPGSGRRALSQGAVLLLGTNEAREIASDKAPLFVSYDSFG